MGSDLVSGIDAAALEVLTRYEEPLARIRLRADYRGITDRSDVAGMRESAASVWFYRDGELVDVIELPVEVPGSEPTTPEHARAMLQDGVSELLALYLDADRPPPLYPARGRGYVDRALVLLRRVMPLIAGVIAAGYLVIALLDGNGLASILLALLAFIGTYIAALPTALIASVMHTALMRWAGNETVLSSAALGAVLGAAFGAITPWLIPLIEPWDLLPIGGVALAGTAVGALYGALATHHAPLPAPSEAPALRDVNDPVPQSTDGEG
ncbi:MAG TPA: hypothetical protein VMM77_02635 [Gemmatimonadaceae bacterium]|nr:hypothetical protein [Gemmatimonadaceae bacterium]